MIVGGTEVASLKQGASFGQVWSPSTALRYTSRSTCLQIARVLPPWPPSLYTAQAFRHCASIVTALTPHSSPQHTNSDMARVLFVARSPLRTLSDNPRVLSLDCSSLHFSPPLVRVLSLPRASLHSARVEDVDFFPHGDPFIFVSRRVLAQHSFAF